MANRAWETQNASGNVFPKPSNKRLQAQGSELQGQIEKHGRPPAYRVEDKGKTEYSKWPVELHSTDEADKKFALRQKIIGTGQPGIPKVDGQGVAVVSDDYWDYISRKEDQAFLADFKAFLYSSMNLSSPEAMAYWKSQVPEVFEDRKKLFEQQLDLVKKQAMINMLGPQSLEDWYFIYLVKKGMIQLPNGRLELGMSQPIDTFERGLFNLRRWWPSQIDNKTPVLEWSAPLADLAGDLNNTVLSANQLDSIFGGNNNGNFSGANLPGAVRLTGLNR